MIPLFLQDHKIPKFGLNSINFSLIKTEKAFKIFKDPCKKFLLKLKLREIYFVQLKSFLRISYTFYEKKR